MAEPALSLQVLGRFRLLYRGTPIGVPSARVQSLLAYLALHAGVSQSRAHLASLFWPDSTDAQARTNLRKLLVEWRRVLPQAERWVAAGGDALAWRTGAGCTTDVEEFERAARGTALESLERACQLYRGDLLPGCHDEWILPERERLRETYLAVLQRLVEGLEARRAYPEAIAHAQHLLAQDPLREDTYRLLMRLHAVTGNHAGAVRVYHACTTVLQRELGVPPGPATREAYTRLLHADARPVPAPLAVPPLVGREREWAQVLAAWKDAAHGPRVVALTGDAGIGKTRLIDELAVWTARQGIASARARCYAAEHRLAYAVAAALLRAQPLPPLDPPWRREVARVLPELAAGRPDLSPLEPLKEGWQRRRLFEALARAVLGSQPLVAAVDDLHWCDRDSLEWLHYLTTHREAVHLLLVVAFRPDEVERGHPLQRVLASWRRSDRLTAVEVAPLDPGATARLAAAAAGEALDAAATERVFRATGGNPLFVIELARSGWTCGDGASAARPLPPRVQAVIQARLERLSPAARGAAGAAAVIGRAFTFALLARVAGGDDATLLGAVDDLWQRRILHESGTDAYDFGHDAVRDAVYGALSPARRAWLHRRTAEALETLHAPSLDEVGGEIASHFDLAGEPARAVPYYRRAAEAARRVYANDLAARGYERLVHLTAGAERIEALRSLGDVREFTGQWAPAVEAYERALALGRDGAEPAVAARCRIALGRVLVRQARYREALAHLERARADRARAGDPAGVCDALLNLGIAHWSQGRYSEALTCYEEMRRLARDAGDRAREAEAAGHMGLVHYERLDYPRALACFEDHLAIARDLGDRAVMARVTTNLGMVFHKQGNYPRAAAAYIEDVRLADAIGDRRTVSLALGNLGTVYQDRGDPPRALACYRTALAMALEIGEPWHAGIVAGNFSRTLLALGEQGPAARILAAAVALGRRRLHGPYFLCKHLCWQAEAALGHGRSAAAKPLAAEAARLAAEVGRRDIQVRAGVLVVRICAALGEIPVRAAAGELERLAAAWSGVHERAAIHYAAWQIDGARDDHRRAAAALYRTAYEAVPNVEYRERYTELTGGALPAPPPLPEVPEVALRPGPPLETLVEELERLAAHGDAAEAEPFVLAEEPLGTSAAPAPGQPA
jgi:DNA-binding SARP family transcriptional activator/Tfp pilus assembly protein PilF